MDEKAESEANSPIECWRFDREALEVTGLSRSGKNPTHNVIDAGRTRADKRQAAHITNPIRYNHACKQRRRERKKPHAEGNGMKMRQLWNDKALVNYELSEQARADVADSKNHEDSHSRTSHRSG